MIEMRAITYQIATRDGPWPVLGHALRLPEPWSDIRLCAQPSWIGARITHYASGCLLTTLAADVEFKPAEFERELIDWLRRASPRYLAMMRAGSHDEARKVWVGWK